jgi:glutaredoxin
MSNKLILFTLNGCGHCKTLKERLKNESLPFTELEVNANKKLWDQVVSQTKLDYLPTFFIRQEGTNNGPVFCPTRDFQGEDEAMDIIKKYITEEKEE